MKKILPSTFNHKSLIINRKNKGFTLVELLIVISILATLAVIGLSVYRGVSSGARDAKRREDIAAIAKAYEVNYITSSSYQTLTSTNFASGSIPKDPVSSKGEYFNIRDSGGSGFKACASLEGNSSNYCNTSALNCFCTTSTQGVIPQTLPSGVTLTTPFTTSNPPVDQTFRDAGVGGSTAPSCDTNGRLRWGLLSYWKMDENTGTTISSSMGGSYIGNFVGASAPVWRTGSECKGGSCLYFGGGVDRFTVTYVNIPSGPTLGTNDFTISAWAQFQVDVVGGGNPQSIIANTVFACHGPSFGEGESYVKYYFDGTSSIYSSQPVSSMLNQWHLFSLTKEGSTYKAYIDTQLIGQRTGSFNLNSNHWEIGYHGDCAGTVRSFKGLIDDVRIYNWALTPTDITNLYGPSGAGCIY